MTREELFEFFDEQLQIWPLARENYNALRTVRKRKFRAEELTGYVQYNPARAVSSLAKLDSVSLKERKCFLCDKNRPEEQKSIDLLNGRFKLLVNPYPILPYHFTIASNDHTDQKFNGTTGKVLAEELPGMAVFFNGAGAGASAPDHLHFQAVPMESVPLICSLVNNPELKLPYNIVKDPEDLNNDNNPVNGFFWKRDNDTRMNFAGIRRKKHRPELFYMEPPERRAVSPGALDLAGIVVIPFEEDFEKISDEEIEKIYKEVCY